MSAVTDMPGQYTCEFNERLGRYQFSNTAQRFGYSFQIPSRERMLYAIANDDVYIEIKEMQMEHGNCLDASQDQTSLEMAETP